ncbi:MAG: hypothetical protein ACYDHZ_11190 [Dehalococcoidia bacterium]
MEDETIPIVLSILTVVAPVTFHDNVDELPEEIEVGLAVKVVITGKLVAFTVIVADAVELPVTLVAVSV